MSIWNLMNIHMPFIVQVYSSLHLSQGKQMIKNSVYQKLNATSLQRLQVIAIQTNFQ